MKKLIALGILFGIVLTTFAQIQNRQDFKLMGNDNFRKHANIADPGVLNGINPYKPVNQTVKGTKAIDKHYISSSSNVYTLLVSESHCLTADDASGMLMFTHRADPLSGLGTSSGDVVTSYSTNAGLSWAQNIVLQNGDNNRYPSGVIYNPNGSTNIANIMSVWCGPAWHGTTTTVWDQNFYGNSNFSGSLSNFQYLNNPTNEEILVRYGMTSCDDGYVHVMGPNYTYNSTTGYMDYRNTLIVNGTYNAGTMSFIWTEVFVPANELVNTVSDGDIIGSYNMQWSQDGNYGWIYYTARDNRNDQFAYQPIAYLSSDQGATWNVKPWFDFGSIAAISNNFWPLKADPNHVVPTFYYWNDGVVDVNGNLHIFLNGQGKYSIHPDSLNYQYTYEPVFLIDVYTTSTGWDAELVDIVYSDQVPADQSGFGTGADAIGWTHRTQGSRSDDGTKVFVVWSDTDTNFSDMNRFPDIKGWGMDVNTSDKTAVTNFTAGTIYAANNFFQYVSNVALHNGSTYTVPVTTADIGATPSDQVGHYYLSGVEFTFTPSSSTIVLITPNTQKVLTSTIFTTTVDIEQVQNLGGFELDITFDPQLLQANSVTLEGFLSSTGRTVFPLANNIDNTNGLIEYAATTLGATPPGPDGDGILITIEWTSTSTLSVETTTDLILQNLQLTQPDGTVIQASTQNASVTVSPCYVHDFDCDCDVDIVDITMAAYCYGTSTGNPNFNPLYDLDSDGDIDIVDITMVAYDYGWVCTKKNIGNKLGIVNEEVGLGMSNKPLPSDGTYEIEIYAENVNQLGAYEFSLSYDPECIEVVKVSKGDFLMNTKRQLFPLEENIDNKNGEIRYAVTTLGSQISGATGSGVLLRITYKSKNDKCLVPVLTNAQLAQIDGLRIDYKLLGQNQNNEENQTCIVGNYPVPFKENMTIKYRLGKKGDINFKVYDITGKLVKQTATEYKDAGIHETIFSRGELKPGLYFYYLEVDNIKVDSRKMIIK